MQGKLPRIATSDSEESTESVPLSFNKANKMILQKIIAKKKHSMAGRELNQSQHLSINRDVNMLSVPSVTDSSTIFA